MPLPTLGLRLRDRLGPEASQELSDAFEEAQDDMLTIAVERYEARLTGVASEWRTELYQTQSEIRQEMARMDAGIRITFAEGLSNIRKEMSEMRVDVIRWSFLFWIGQVIATATVVGFMLKSIGH